MTLSGQTIPPSKLLAELQDAYPNKLDLMGAIFDKYAQQDDNKILCAILKEWWESVGNHLTLDELRSTVASGPHRGKSFLWWIAHTACFYNESEEGAEAPDYGILTKIWKKYGPHLQMNDLRVIAAEGEWQGTSVLWQILYAYELSNQDETIYVFMSDLFKRFSSHFQMTDFKVRAEAGKMKGASLLWLLADSSGYSDDGELLQRVWLKFEEEWKIEDLREGYTDEERGYLSILMLLLEADNRQLTEAMWRKFKKQLLLTDLRRWYNYPYNFSKFSALWKLFNHATFSAFFNEITGTFKDQLLLEDWRTVYEGGDFDGVTVLTLAAQAFKKHPQPVMHFWEKFKKSVQASDLSANMNQLVENGTLMEFLAMLAFEDDNFLASKIVEEAFSQVADDLDKEQSFVSPDVIKYIEVCSQHPWAEQMLKLVAARSAFFEEMRKIKATKISVLSPFDIKELFVLARHADEQGYRNAFYDLAQFLLTYNHPAEAYQAYIKVSSSALRYQQAQYELAAMLIQQALEDPKERKEKLLEACRFALKVAQEDLRYSLINQIAYLYFSEENSKEGLNINFIPEWLIRSLSQEANIEYCFDLFKIEFDKYQLEKQNILKNSKKRPAEEDLHSTRYVSRALVTAYQNSLSALVELLPTDSAEVEEKDKHKNCFRSQA